MARGALEMQKSRAYLKCMQWSKKNEIKPMFLKTQLIHIKLEGIWKVKSSSEHGGKQGGDGRASQAQKHGHGEDRRAR